MIDSEKIDQKEIELIQKHQNNNQQSKKNTPNENIIYNTHNGLIKFKLHIKLLLQKNFIIIFRNFRNYLFLFLSPLIVILSLQFWQYTVQQITNFSPILEGDIIKNEMLQKCYGTTDCVTVGYAIVGPKEIWIDYVMNYVAATNNLQYGKDVQLQLQGSPKEYMKYIENNKNKTKIGVIFCTSSWPIYEDLSVDLPCTFEKLQDNHKLLFYSIIYNWTLSWKSPYLQDLKTPYPKDKDLIRLKSSLDNGILDFFSKNKGDDAFNQYNQVQTNIEEINYFQNELQKGLKEKINLSYQDFPKSKSRFFDGYDMASSNGAFYFFIPFMIQFIIVINEILREKEKMLRQGITVVGMTHMSYWISWFLTSSIITIVLVTIQIIFSFIFEIKILTKTPIFISFVFYWTFGISIQSIAYLITTLCQNVKTGYTVAYGQKIQFYIPILFLGFLLLSLVMQLFLSNNIFIYYLYLDDSDFFTITIRKIFNFYPTFHYSKIYGDIAYKSGSHFSVDEGRWLEGQGFQYQHLTELNEGSYITPLGTKSYHAPNTLESYCYLILNIAFFFIFTWYCDHVFPGNRGTTDSPFFFISNEYWKCFKRNKNRKYSGNNNGIGFNYKETEKIDTVKMEIERVLSNKMNNYPVKGIRIMKLGKTYSRYPFGIKSKLDVTALKDVYLEIHQGELLAILGHNGAGKSTLINVLIGILSPTTGTAEIMDYDIKDDMDSIRNIIGVCPQFDILWDELTVFEHLRMYCILKCIPLQNIEYEIDNKLRHFNMIQYKNARISTLSGGQRRRISLSICCIGDPQIIFMDEPTTGMDPKTRRGVWELIRELKQNRVIILTTHGMDEADALSDRIAVINEGTFECIGTSLYLKNNFGDGYRLTIVTDIANIEYIKTKTRQFLPSSSIIDDSGGSVIISVPIKNQLELKNFFQIMENQNKEIYQNQIEFRNLIKDWGLSHATLEEVFMKITRKNKRFFQ